MRIIGGIRLSQRVGSKDQPTCPTERPCVRWHPATYNPAVEVYVIDKIPKSIGTPEGNTLRCETDLQHTIRLIASYDPPSRKTYIATLPYLTTPNVFAG